MRLLRCARLFLTTGLLILCSAVFTARAQQTQFDGSWSGPTGQGKSVSFTVSGGSVTTVSFIGTIAGCSGVFGLVGFPTQAINNNAFTITSTTSTPGGISYTLSGTFTSTSAANGTLNFTYNGCGGPTSTTWTASRAGAQPTSPFPNKPVLTFVPHFAAGQGYVTHGAVTNLSSASNTVVVNYIGQIGNLLQQGAPQTLAPGATVVFDSGEGNRAGSLDTKWLAIGSDAPISTGVLFECCDSATTTTAVGVLGQQQSQTPSLTFRAPFLFLPQSGSTLLTLGLALANLSDQSNTLTLTLFDQNGTQVAQDQLTLPAFNQTAFDPFFTLPSPTPSINRFLGGQTTFFAGSLTVAGTRAFAPVYLGNLSGRLFSLPLTGL